MVTRCHALVSSPHEVHIPNNENYLLIFALCICNGVCRAEIITGDISQKLIVVGGYYLMMITTT